MSWDDQTGGKTGWVTLSGRRPGAMTTEEFESRRYTHWQLSVLCTGYLLLPASAREYTLFFLLLQLLNQLFFLCLPIPQFPIVQLLPRSLPGGTTIYCVFLTRTDSFISLWPTREVSDSRPCPDFLVTPKPQPSASHQPANNQSAPALRTPRNPEGTLLLCYRNPLA